MILADRLLQVFHWPVSHQIRLLLPFMIVVSLLLHVAGIYLLRADAPSRGASLPPLPGRVTVIPAADSLMLAARDPSWLQPGRYRDRLLPPPQVNRPLRALQPELPPLVPAPSEESSYTWVPSLPPLSVQPRLEARVAASVPVLSPVTARFDAGGPEVTDDVLNRLRAAAPLRPPGAPTELLLVLDASGAVRHAWLVRSSGDAALDAAAIRAVQLSRFGPGASAHRGMLRIVWGTGGGSP